MAIGPLAGLFADVIVAPLPDPETVHISLPRRLDKLAVLPNLVAKSKSDIAVIIPLIVYNADSIFLRRSDNVLTASIKTPTILPYDTLLSPSESV